MKVLVTGGSGYIGSHTLIELIKHGGFEVVSVDNFMNSSPDTFDRIKEITGVLVKNYKVDLRNLEETKRIFLSENNIEGVIHFAALKSVPESVENPLLYYDNNINSLNNILKCMDEFGVKNLIFSSSCSVYGNVQQLPVTEETALSKAECAYAHTKQIGEEMLEAFAKIADVKTIALRYFNPVGAHNSGLIGENPINKPSNLVPVITAFAAGKISNLFVHGTDYPTRDGSCIRDYIHVSDIADAHVKALEALQKTTYKNKFEIINLGNGLGISVLEALNAFEKVTGKKLNYQLGPRRSGDVAAIYSENKKAISMLNWQPKFNIEQMMETAWKWQQHITPTN